jgi:hypothetical protein
LFGEQPHGPVVHVLGKSVVFWQQRPLLMVPPVDVHSAARPPSPAASLLDASVAPSVALSGVASCVLASLLPLSGVVESCTATSDDASAPASVLVLSPPQATTKEKQTVRKRRALIRPNVSGLGEE